MRRWRWQSVLDSVASTWALLRYSSMWTRFSHAVGIALEALRRFVFSALSSYSIISFFLSFSSTRLCPSAVQTQISIFFFTSFSSFFMFSLPNTRHTYKTYFSYFVSLSWGFVSTIVHQLKVRENDASGWDRTLNFKSITLYNKFLFERTSTKPNIVRTKLDFVDACGICQWNTLDSKKVDIVFFLADKLFFFFHWNKCNRRQQSFFFFFSPLLGLKH